MRLWRSVTSYGLFVEMGVRMVMMDDYWRGRRARGLSTSWGAATRVT